MLFRSHLVFAGLVFLFFVRYLEMSNYSKLLFGIFLFLATIFVDIDSRNSKIGNHWFFRPIQWFFSHRGMIHSLLAMLFFSFVIYFFSQIMAFGFFIGYLAHLFLDSLTKEGIFLFWPVYNKKISFVNIKAGGIFEEIFFVLVLLLDVYYTCRIFF
jgi:inner membrane protein